MAVLPSLLTSVRPEDEGTTCPRGVLGQGCGQVLSKAPHAQPRRRVALTGRPALWSCRGCPRRLVSLVTRPVHTCHSSGELGSARPGLTEGHPAGLAEPGAAGSPGSPSHPTSLSLQGRRGRTSEQAGFPRNSLSHVFGVKILGPGPCQPSDGLSCPWARRGQSRSRGVRGGAGVAFGEPGEPTALPAIEGGS